MTPQKELDLGNKVFPVLPRSKESILETCPHCLTHEDSCTYCREKSILTLRWHCFFDLLFVAFVIIITQNGLPQRILPFCLTVKLQCLCSEPSLPVYRRKVMGLDLDTAKHFSGSLSPLPSSTSHLPSLSLASLSSTTVWIFPTGREKTIAASTHSLHTPLYFQPKTKLSFLQHQFQGRVPIGSPKVTRSFTGPITDA